MMNKLKYLSFFFVFMVSVTYAQLPKLTQKAEISVITCGPGEELYSTFGHSAIRILDIPQRIDRVYNYGTFNFDTPNFYLKFVRGKLLYELRAYNFGAFLRSYHREKRWVKGQVLDLTQDDKQKIFEFLEHNALPENRAYRYDFFYDNCSTRIYDVLEKTMPGQLIFDNQFEKEGLTHRDLIKKYLTNLPWSEFGIDLALGSVIDRKASSKEYMFLPDYVWKALEKVKIKDQGQIKPIVKRNEDILLQFDPPKKEKHFFTPMLVFGLLALLVVFFTYRDFKNNRRNKILDILVFSLTGLTGMLILFLWFATDHSATADNFNILWAFAPNLLFLFFINKNIKMGFYYLFTLLGLLDVLVLIWIFKIEIFNLALIPILIALYTRYLYLWFYFKKKLKQYEKK